MAVRGQVASKAGGPSPLHLLRPWTSRESPRRAHTAGSGARDKEAMFPAAGNAGERRGCRKHLAGTPPSRARGSGRPPGREAGSTWAAWEPSAVAGPRQGVPVPISCPLPKQMWDPQTSGCEAPTIDLCSKGPHQKGSPQAVSAPSLLTHTTISIFWLLTLGDTGAPSLLHPQLFK